MTSSTAGKLSWAALAAAPPSPAKLLNSPQTGQASAVVAAAVIRQPAHVAKGNAQRPSRSKHQQHSNVADEIFTSAQTAALHASASALAPTAAPGPAAVEAKVVPHHKNWAAAVASPPAKPQSVKAAAPLSTPPMQAPAEPHSDPAAAHNKPKDGKSAAPTQANGGPKDTYPGQAEPKADPTVNKNQTPSMQASEPHHAPSFNAGAAHHKATPKPTAQTAPSDPTPGRARPRAVPPLNLSKVSTAGGSNPIPTLPLAPAPIKAPTPAPLATKAIPPRAPLHPASPFKHTATTFTPDMAKALSSSPFQSTSSQATALQAIGTMDPVITPPGKNHGIPTAVAAPAAALKPSATALTKAAGVNPPTMKAAQTTDAKQPTINSTQAAMVKPPTMNTVQAVSLKPAPVSSAQPPITNLRQGPTADMNPASITQEASKPIAHTKPYSRPARSSTASAHQASAAAHGDRGGSLQHKNGKRGPRVSSVMGVDRRSSGYMPAHPVALPAAAVPGVMMVPVAPPATPRHRSRLMTAQEAAEYAKPFGPSYTSFTETHYSTPGTLVLWRLETGEVLYECAALAGVYPHTNKHWYYSADTIFNMSTIQAWGCQVYWRPDVTGPGYLGPHHVIMDNVCGLYETYQGTVVIYTELSLDTAHPWYWYTNVRTPRGQLLRPRSECWKDRPTLEQLYAVYPPVPMNAPALHFGTFN